MIRGPRTAARRRDAPLPNTASATPPACPSITPHPAPARGAAGLPPLRNKEAAYRLGIAVSTVKNLNTDLFRRNGVEDRAQAVAWCDDHLPGWRERSAA